VKQTINTTENSNKTIITSLKRSLTTENNNATTIFLQKVSSKEKSGKDLPTATKCLIYTKHISSFHSFQKRLSFG